ncbi:VTC domain-containing protein [Peribacillus sp. NPDC096622]|uniref:VTC domain-containing protein n=1 Tax=Peribacillus sp. NPDC096622 TaxID=3364396 RepID=UPI0037F87B4E
MNGLKGRRELKHAITKADCHLLRKNLKNFMRLDPHGLDGKYLIRSVYFDNFDNKILRQKTAGFYHRDKCRLSAREYERIRSGDIDWMSGDSRNILRDLYVQMTLFQIKPTNVVDLKGRYSSMSTEMCGSPLTVM